MRTFIIASLIAVTVAVSFTAPSQAVAASRGDGQSRGETRSSDPRGDYFDGVLLKKRYAKIKGSGAYCVSNKVRHYDDYGNVYFERVRHCDDRVDIEIR